MPPRKFKLKQIKIYIQSDKMIFWFFTEGLQFKHGVPFAENKRFFEFKQLFKDLIGMCLQDL